MLNSNTMDQTLEKIQNIQMMALSQFFTVRKMFVYSPEDKFKETKAQADRKEALAAADAMRKGDEYDAKTPKFNYWL